MNDLSPQARRVVDLARGQDDPDELTVARVERGLAVRLALGAGVAGTSTALTASATGSSAPLAVKALAALGLTAGLGGGAWLGAEHFHHVTPPSAASIATRNDARPAAARAADREQSGASAPATITSPESLPSTRAPEPSVPSQDRSPPAPRATSNVGAGAGISAGGNRHENAPPTPSSVAPSDDPLRAETAALRVAQRALRSGDARGALALLDQQDATFRTGSLEEERAAARVLAQCQAYGPDGVRGAADRFEQRFPQSALLARVRSACRERSLPATKESIQRK